MITSMTRSLVSNKSWYRSMLAGNEAYSPGINLIGLFSSSLADLGYGIAIAPSGNFYVTGSSSKADTTADNIVAKYNSLGILQWQRKLGFTGRTDSGYAIDLDASENVYISGQSQMRATVIKYNTSGTLQWQNSFYDPDINYSIQFSAGAVDSSNNFYVGGSSGSGTQLAKYDTSGSIQWQLGSGAGGATGIATDSSDNFYVSAAGGVFKFDSSATLLWQRKLGTPSSSTAVAVDSSGNVYVTYNFTSNGVVAKWDSSGNLVWQRQLASASFSGVAIDASGNVFIAGSTGSDALVAKYNSSGDIQWQRTLATSSTEVFRSVTIDVFGVVWLTGYSNISGNNDFLIVAVPNNGTKTATYTVGSYSFVYAASSLTASTPTQTATTPTLSFSATGWASGGYSATGSASSLTWTNTII